MILVKLLFSDYGRVYSRTRLLDPAKVFMYRTALLAEPHLTVDVGFGDETLISIEKISLDAVRIRT